MEDNPAEEWAGETQSEAAVACLTKMVEEATVFAILVNEGLGSTNVKVLRSYPAMLNNMQDAWTMFLRSLQGLSTIGYQAVIAGEEMDNQPLQLEEALMRKLVDRAKEIDEGDAHEARRRLLMMIEQFQEVRKGGEIARA